MESGITKEKPDEVVAKNIKEKLSGKKLLREDDFKTIEVKLSAGKITEQDWVLMAELSIEKGVEVGNG